MKNQYFRYLFVVFMKKGTSRLKILQLGNADFYGRLLV